MRRCARGLRLDQERPRSADGPAAAAAAAAPAGHARGAYAGHETDAPSPPGEAPAFACQACGRTFA
eukprot:2769976-Alexandrium_andersonii.AAC.1